MPAIAPLIPTAIQLVIGIIKAAKEAKELSEKEFDEFKSQLDEEFANIPDWDKL